VGWTDCTFKRFVQWLWTRHLGRFTVFLPVLTINVLPKIGDEIGDKMATKWVTKLATKWRRNKNNGL
jgi:methylaspartate ammonia-lyase